MKESGGSNHDNPNFSGGKRVSGFGKHKVRADTENEKSESDLRGQNAVVQRNFSGFIPGVSQLIAPAHREPTIPEPILAEIKIKSGGSIK